MAIAPNNPPNQVTEPTAAIPTALVVDGGFVSALNPIPTTTGGSPQSAVTTLYTVTTQFVDANGTCHVNDLLQNIVIYNGLGAQIINVWNNTTAGFTLAAPPPGGDVAVYIPGGAATAANQVTEIAELTAISGQLPATLGAKATTASLAVNIASDQVVPVSATALPLPAGAATSALQTTGNTTLSSIATSTATTATEVTAISGQLPPTLGLQAAGASMSVVVANQASGDVVATALFTADIAGTGYALNDVLQSISVYTPGTPNVFVSATWKNLTQQTTLAAAPPASDITPVTGGGGSGAGSSTVVNTYLVTTPFVDGVTNIALNDVLQQILIFDSTGTLIATTWYDLTISYTLLSAPPPADITLQAGSNATAANQLTQISQASTGNTTLSNIQGLQTTANTSLASVVTNTGAISGKLPPALGLQTSGNSLSVVVANQTSGDIAASSLYEVITGGTGYAIGDILQAIAIYLPGAPATLISTTWNNLTQQTVLASAPTTANIVPVTGGSGAVTTDVDTSVTYYAIVANPGQYAVNDVIQRILVLDPTAIPPTVLSVTFDNITTGVNNITIASQADLVPIGTPVPQATEATTVAYYTVNNPFLGAALNDTIQRVDVIDTANQSVLSTTWNNISQNTVLAGTPTMTNLTAQQSQLPPALGAQAAADSLSVYVVNPSTGGTSVVNTYTVTTGWTDSSQAIAVNDTLQQILVFSSIGVLTSTIWYDVTLAYTLVAPPPSASFVVFVTSSSATAGNQLTQITEATTTNTKLTTISGQLPGLLGLQVAATSLSTVLATDAVLPLPTGASTSALQTAGNSTLTTITGQLPPALGAQTIGNSLAVNIANQSAGNIATTTQYRVVTGWTGAAIGDTVLRIEVFNPSNTTQIAEIWLNQTQGTQLATGAPNYAAVALISGGSVTPVLPAVTASVTTATSTGSTTAGAVQVSFANNGAGTVTVAGGSLPAGASLDFTAPSGGTINSITYDATGSSLLVAVLI